MDFVKVKLRVLGCPGTETIELAEKEQLTPWVSRYVTPADVITVSIAAVIKEEAVEIHEPPMQAEDIDVEVPRSNPRNDLMPIYLRVPRDITEEQAREFKYMFPSEYETWRHITHR